MASLGPEQDDGDVVGAAGVVGGVDQGGAGGGAVGLGGEELGDAGVGDRLGEAVGAEQDLVAGVEVDGVGGVDGDAGVEADGPGEDAALGVDGGLGGGEAAAADQLADDGVVGGDLVEGAVAEEVGAAVADMGQLELPLELLGIPDKRRLGWHRRAVVVRHDL